MTENSSGNKETLSQLNYIVGIGRSGSTLLTTMLNANSEVKAIPEIPITIFFANRYKYIQGKNQLLEIGAKSYLSIYQKMRPEDLVDLGAEKIDFQDCEYRSYHAFLSKVFEHFTIAGKSGNTKLIIDKNPYYTFHYRRLKKLSPNPKFIVLTRDYRANILSRKSKSLNKPSNVAFNAFRWRIFHKKLAKFQHNGDCLITRYEDLVQNQVAELTRICQFLNINYESATIGSRIVDNVSTTIEDEKTKEFASEHFQGLTKPVYQDRLEAWKSELTAEEIKLSELICGELGLIYGYKMKKQSTAKYLLAVGQYFRWYVKANYSIYKEYPIYFLPPWVKLKRLKQVERSK
jgi:hypothetical protein